MAWTEEQYIAASERIDDLYFEDRIEEAEVICESILAHAEAAGHEAFILFFQGNLAWLRGNNEGALGLFLRANELRPNCHLILRNAGTILSILGRRDEAIEWYDKALGIRPDDSRCLTDYGQTLEELGRHKEALERFDKALEIEPGLSHLQRNRAVALGRLGKKREAAEALRRCLGRNPTDQVAKFWLARFAGVEEAQAILRESQEQWRQSEQAEREARERKIKLDAWRSLSARSAHRIGNQLFASRGALRTLHETVPAEAAEAVADLQESLDRIRRIVQEFQTFSASEEPRLRATDVNHLLKDLVRRYDGLADDVELSAHVAATLPRCLLDASQMDQAIGELLENAIHHTEAGGTIRVKADAAGAP